MCLQELELPNLLIGSAAAVVCRRVWIGTEQGVILVYNHSGMLMQQLHRHAGGVQSIVENEGSVWSCSRDFTTLEWNGTTGEFKRSFVGHKNGVRAIAVIRPQLWTASDDRTIRIWDLVTARCSQTLTSHKAAVLSMTLAGGFVWSGDEAGEVKIWKCGAHAQLLTSIETSFRLIRELVHVSGEVWAVGDQPTAHVWNGDTMAYMWAVPLHGVHCASGLVAVSEQVNHVLWAYSSSDKVAKVVQGGPYPVVAGGIKGAEARAQNSVLRDQAQNLETCLAATVSHLWDIQEELTHQRKQFQSTVQTVVNQVTGLESEMGKLQAEASRDKTEWEAKVKHAAACIEPVLEGLQMAQQEVSAL